MFDLNQGRQDIIIVPGVINCFSCSPAATDPSWTVEVSGTIVAVPITTPLTAGTTTVVARNGFVVLPMPELYVLAGNIGRKNLVCTDLVGTEYEARLISPGELKILLKFSSHHSSLPPVLTPPEFSITILEDDELILKCRNTVPSTIGRLQILDPNGMVVGITKYQVQNVSRTNARTYSCIVSSALPNNTNSLTVIPEVIICKSPPYLYYMSLSLGIMYVEHFKETLNWLKEACS